MKSCKKYIWSSAIVAAVAVSLAVSSQSSAQRVVDGGNVTKADLGVGGLDVSANQSLQNSTPPLCESTGFEPIGSDNPPAGDASCGWNLGWICDEAHFSMCTGPLVGGCTEPDPLVAGGCCADFPNPHNGWFRSSASLSCTEPSIEDVNPASGLQHMRIGTDESLPTTANISVFTPVDSGPYAIAPWSVEFDQAMGNPILTPPFGNRMLFLLLGGDPVGFNGRLHFIGSGSSQGSELSGMIITYDYGAGSYQYVAYASGDGNYDHFTISADPCVGELTYTVETSDQHFSPGVYSYTATFGGGQGLTHVRSTWQSGSVNVGGHYDVDNYVVTRSKEACPVECGNNIIEPGESCETNNDSACPGRCVDCNCTPICTLAAPCILQNGENGPYYGPFDPGAGGIWLYAGDTPSVGFDFCGSQGGDTLIRVYDAADTGAGFRQNDDCEDGPFGANLTTNASCYNAITPGPWESCTCFSSPSNTYLVQNARLVGPGEVFFVNVSKKDVCDGDVLGSCCNRDEGSCVDNVIEAECAAPAQIDCCSAGSCTESQSCLDAVNACDDFCTDMFWDENCAGPNAFVPGCSAMDLCPECAPAAVSWSTAKCETACAYGACCDTTPGSGGVCTDNVAEEDCQGSQQSFSSGALCGDVECLEATGSCCDSSPGAGGACTDGVLAADCEGPQQTWRKGLTCDEAECAEATGACCNRSPGAGGACTDDVLSADCQGNQQTWTKGASCDEVDCDEAVGSCCNGLTGDCSETLQSGCAPGEQVVWTKGGSCSACAAAFGACCDGETGECSSTIMADCNCEQCTWTKGADCSEIECEGSFTAIPTVSEWGLVIMALLLLVGGKVYFGRRQVAMA